MEEKRALSVGIGTESLNDVSSHFESAHYASEAVPTARSALTLLADIHFDLVVLAHPLRGLELRRFLTELRRVDAESRGAKVLVLAADPLHPDLQDLHQHGLEIVLSPDPLIGSLATKVLSGDRRVPLTIMVRLEAHLPYGKSVRIYQSENISVSGMLVRTEDTLPIGTAGLARFALPGESDPIEAQAQVVRLTAPGEVPGIALHFDQLDAGDRSRLELLLARLED